jgi:hypothetical protein
MQYPRHIHAVTLVTFFAAVIAVHGARYTVYVGTGNYLPYSPLLTAIFLFSAAAVLLLSGGALRAPRWLFGHTLVFSYLGVSVFVAALLQSTPLSHAVRIFNSDALVPLATILAAAAIGAYARPLPATSRGTDLIGLRAMLIVSLGIVWLGILHQLTMISVQGTSAFALFSEGYVPNTSVQSYFDIEVRRIFSVFPHSLGLALSSAFFFVLVATVFRSRFVLLGILGLLTLAALALALQRTVLLLFFVAFLAVAFRRTVPDKIIVLGCIAAPYLIIPGAHFFVELWLNAGLPYDFIRTLAGRMDSWDTLISYIHEEGSMQTYLFGFAVRQGTDSFKELAFAIDNSALSAMLVGGLPFALGTAAIQVHILSFLLRDSNFECYSQPRSKLAFPALFRIALLFLWIVIILSGMTGKTPLSPITMPFYFLFLILALSPCSRDRTPAAAQRASSAA